MTDKGASAVDDGKGLTLPPEDFEFVSRLVLDRSAIVIEPHRAYLIEARLVPLARRFGYENSSALVGGLRKVDVADPLVQATVEAMTTNETSFFRDYHPFVALKEEVIPKLIEARQSSRELTIWCAASSSGQEPYTIAMILRENFPELEDWTLNLIATDISNEVLQRAEEGIYTQLEINRGLPAAYLVKYFEKIGPEWQLKESIRDMVTFMPLNLIEPWPTFPSPDIVFMRNVLIYFDLETKRHIIERMLNRLRPDGYMFMGSAETVLNRHPGFHPTTHGKAIYYSRTKDRAHGSE